MSGYSTLESASSPSSASSNPITSPSRLDTSPLLKSQVEVSRISEGAISESQVSLSNTLHEPHSQMQTSNSLESTNITISQSTSVPGTSSNSNLSSITNSAPTTSNDNGSSNRPRRNPFNSVIWLFIEFNVTLAQILAISIVLILSRDEKPGMYLSLWIIGYFVSCLISMPLIILRFKYRNIPVSSNPQPVSSNLSRTESANVPSSQESYVSIGSPIETQSSLRNALGTHTQSLLWYARVTIFLERAKTSLDFFYALWFVFGNVWVFGGFVDPNNSPNIYKLVAALLIIMCIGYALPFILCASICCCLPCIIAILRITDEPMRGKGASAQDIKALPVCKFCVSHKPEAASKASKSKSKSKSNDLRSDSSLSDGENEDVSGTIWTGTEKERFVSSEDANCCICLGIYRNGVELKELPCQHHFHVSCVDKWLKINGCCPLCKVSISPQSVEDTEASNENRQSNGV